MVLVGTLLTTLNKPMFALSGWVYATFGTVATLYWITAGGAKGEEGRTGRGATDVAWAPRRRTPPNHAPPARAPARPSARPPTPRHLHHFLLSGKVFDRMSKGIREAPGKALIGDLAAVGGDRPEGAFGAWEWGLGCKGWEGWDGVGVVGRAGGGWAVGGERGTYAHERAAALPLAPIPGPKPTPRAPPPPTPPPRPPPPPPPVCRPAPGPGHHGCPGRLSRRGPGLQTERPKLCADICARLHPRRRRPAADGDRVWPHGCRVGGRQKGGGKADRRAVGAAAARKAGRPGGCADSGLLAGLGRRRPALFCPV